MGVHSQNLFPRAQIPPLTAVHHGTPKARLLPDHFQKNGNHADFGRGWDSLQKFRLHQINAREQVAGIPFGVKAASNVQNAA
jgi:hypothetical protein